MTNDEFKSKLWEAADKLRGSVSAAQYKYPVLGLVFLKYVSDLFDAQADVIRDRVAEPTSEYYIEDPAIRESAAAVRCWRRQRWQISRSGWTRRSPRSRQRMLR